MLSVAAGLIASGRRAEHGGAHLPIGTIGHGPNGLMVGMTAAEFDAAVKALR
jgi:hypothetical protein